MEDFSQLETTEEQQTYTSKESFEIQIIKILYVGTSLEFEIVGAVNLYQRPSFHQLIKKIRAFVFRFT